MNLMACPNCHKKVLPNPDGTCPNCWAVIPQAQKAPTPPALEAPNIIEAGPPAASIYDMAAALKRDLRGAGIIFILWGALPFLFPQSFSRVWGAFFILLGMVNFLVRDRRMFIICGLAFIAVAIWNIGNVFLAFSLISHTSSSLKIIWIFIGILQIIFGVQMLGKYKEYAPGQFSGRSRP
jgi:hypothetical protein